MSDSLHRWVAMEILVGTHDEQHLIACANMDGSWWVDWDRASRFVEDHADKPDHRCTVMLLKLLTAARGSYPEVTFERSQEIAVESGRLADKR